VTKLRWDGFVMAVTASVSNTFKRLSVFLTAFSFVCQVSPESVFEVPQASGVLIRIV
jgi:hypothetical protein